MLKNTRAILCTISVILTIASTSKAADSLSVSPAHPTTADSIRLNIVIPNWNCCTRYYEDSTVLRVSDTMVELAYQYDETPVVCPLMACIVGGYMLPFKSGPLLAGTYSVYEHPSLYCTSACAPQAFILTKIGSFTVAKPTFVAHQFYGNVAGLAYLRPSATASRFTIRGQLLNRPSLSSPFRGIAVMASESHVSVLQLVH